MENKRICAIVQDLLPAYVDKLTKPETTVFVDQHLTDCESCRRVCRAMAGDMPPEAIQAEAVVRRLQQKRRRRIALGWGLAAVLALIAAVCLLPWPRGISVTHEGFEWRVNDENHGVLRSVRLEGTYYDYLFREDRFAGEVVIDGYPAARSAAVSTGNGQIWLQYADGEGMTRSLGFMYLRPDGTEVLIGLYEDGGWSGRDGLMLTAPEFLRAHAVITANHLIDELDHGWLSKFPDFD